MKRRFLLLLLALSLSLSSNMMVHAAPRAQHIFIVSFDGGKPEA